MLLIGGALLAAAPARGMCRDLNQDDQVNVQDVIRALQDIVNLTPLPPEIEAAGDLDQDQALTVQDAILLLRTLVGMTDPETVPCNEPRLGDPQFLLGIYFVRFETPIGSVVVNLPDDLTAGDTLSGSFGVVPKGKTAEIQQRSLQALQGYSVEVAGQGAPIAQGWGSWILPAGVTSVPVALRDGNGDLVLTTDIPVLAQPPVPFTLSAGSRPLGASPDFQLPRIGDSGSPNEIHGPFDGNFQNTAVDLGGSSVPLLGESPRKLMFFVPSGFVGPTTLGLTTVNTTVQSPFSSLKLTLSYKSLLKIGETTPVLIQLAGMEGLDVPTELFLEDLNPEIVSLDGGSQQWIVIPPTDVKPDGTYGLDRPATGVQLGVANFLVMAEDEKKACVPKLKCPADLVKDADSKKCTWTPLSNLARAQDVNKCPKVTIKGERDDGKKLHDPFPLGTTTITWTATDEQGNTDTCEQTVTVRARINCQPNPVTVVGQCEATVKLVKPTLAVICQGVTLPDGVRDDGKKLDDPYPVGTTTITWTAMMGNQPISAPCLQKVVVVSPNGAPAVGKPKLKCEAKAGIETYSAEISWTNPAGANSFVMIERKEKNGGTWSTVYDAAVNAKTTSFVDGALKGETEYEYRVKFYQKDANGKVVACTNPTSVNVKTPLNFPTVKSKAVDKNTVEVNITNNSKSANKVELWRWIPGKTDPQKVATVKVGPGETVDYTDKNLEPETNYRYIARSVPDPIPVGDVPCYSDPFSADVTTPK
jgi:hypothetical protein